MVGVGLRWEVDAEESAEEEGRGDSLEHGLLCHEVCGLLGETHVPEAHMGHPDLGYAWL